MELAMLAAAVGVPVLPEPMVQVQLAVTVEMEPRTLLLELP
jgi:hypothetical protein